MDLPEEAKRAPSAPVWNQSFPSPNFNCLPRKGKQLKGGTSQVPVRVQPPKDSSSDEALNVDIPGQPGLHPPSVSSSSPGECQDQSKLCISLSLEMKKYCTLKYSRCDLHDGFQTLNARYQRVIYNLPVVPRFVHKASSLSSLS